MTASTGHTKAEAENLERAARKLLELPCLPDGANGPRGKAILEQINADKVKLGKAATLRKWAHVSTMCHACMLPEDPPEHKAHPSVRDVSVLKHPDKDEYHYPTGKLVEKLSDPSARAECNHAELSALDTHAAAAKPLPEEWKTKEPKEKDK